jgi:hypothetical protein
VRLASCLLALLALPVAGDAARGAGHAIRVPEGFTVEVYARGLERPTALEWGPGGALFATQEGGSLVRLRPPTPLTVDPEGALLVADYGRGFVYRIQADGKR